MNYSIEIVPSEHEHMPNFESPPVADIATHAAHLDYQSTVERLEAGPKEIRNWHTTIDPLDSTPAPCMYEFVTRRETLTNGAMLMIAYSLGYEGKSDVRDFFKDRGVLARHTINVSTADLPRGIVHAEAPMLSRVMVEEFNQAAENGIDRKHIPDLHYAAELALDNSQLPLHDYVQPFYRDRLVAYANSEPTTMNAGFRAAAYAGLNAVVENVSRLDDPSLEESVLSLTAAQHILAMRHMDWVGFLYMNRHNFPDLMGDGHTFRKWEGTDIVSILQSNYPALYNTGYSTIDDRVLQPWTIESAVKEDLSKSITQIIEMVKSPEGIAAMLPKRRYGGLVHESIWLIDAVMLTTAFKIGNLGFTRALTREDRNFMVNKPDLKRTFDIRVVGLMERPNEFVQLKSTERSAQRGNYAKGIKVVVEQGFNDTHPGRLANKLKTYRAILNEELPEYQAQQMLQRLALKSTIRTILAN